MPLIRFIGLDGVERAAAFEAADILSSGGVIIYPAETLYGIGANCDDESAVVAVNEVKMRGRDEPQIVLIKGDWVEKYVVPNRAVYALLEAFCPGPLTILAKARRGAVVDILSPGERIAFRVSSSWFVDEILSITGKGLTSTSANISNRKPICEPDEIIATFWDKVDGMFLFKNLPLDSPPSTIVDVSEYPERFEIIREGAISRKAVEAVLTSVK